MSEKLKIKVSIAERVYPLTVDASQEENLINASKKIEAMINQFEKNYEVRDKQDLLAMCALQFAAQTQHKQKEELLIDVAMIDKLKKMNSFLDNYIEE